MSFSGRQSALAQPLMQPVRSEKTGSGHSLAIGPIAPNLPNWMGNITDYLTGGNVAILASQTLFNHPLRRSLRTLVGIFTESRMFIFATGRRGSVSFSGVWAQWAFVVTYTYDTRDIIWHPTPLEQLDKQGRAVECSTILWMGAECLAQIMPALAVHVGCLDVVSPTSGVVFRAHRKVWGQKHPKRHLIEPSYQEAVSKLHEDSH